MRYARTHFLGTGEKGVLIVDKTRVLKKGQKSAGVQRLYSETARRIENCQIGVFLALSSSKGRTLLNRKSYILKGWIEDRARCREAVIPDKVTFSTKQRLTQKMLSHALESDYSPA